MGWRQYLKCCCSTFYFYSIQVPFRWHKWGKTWGRQNSSCFSVRSLWYLVPFCFWTDQLYMLITPTILLFCHSYHLSFAPSLVVKRNFVKQIKFQTETTICYCTVYVRQRGKVWKALELFEQQEGDDSILQRWCARCLILKNPVFPLWHYIICFSYLIFPDMELIFSVVKRKAKFWNLQTT